MVLGRARLQPCRLSRFLGSGSNADEQTLRVTPAMEAGISNHVWSVEELVGLVEGTNVAVA